MIWDLTNDMAGNSLAVDTEIPERFVKTIGSSASVNLRQEKAVPNHHVLHID